MDDAALVNEIKKRRDACTSSEEHNAFPFQMVAEHGALGYAVASYGPEDGEVYYELDKLPPGCPFPGNLEPGALIDRVWAPVAEVVPKFVAALKARCKHALVLHRTKSNTKNERGWFLGYFVDRGSEHQNRYGDIWGREPFERPKLRKKTTKAGFSLPASLRLFYKVHNGMGMSTARTHGVEALLSAKNLEPLMPHPNLLEVYCDSGGNRKAYPKGEDRIVDWDRSTDDKANQGSLWRLLETEILHHVTGEDYY